ncbi:MAG: hypothetical protein JRI23_12285, partial [Deltaproteobacteria bacterium]|nr:hypothetical protein [Deltaproteobacteria bacterium]MBW2532490.1 hypothetical protein [Deltaproteobacteria bacterium]
GTGGAGGTGGATGGAGGGISCGDGWECLPASPEAKLMLLPTGATCPSDWSQEVQLYDDTDPTCQPCTCGASTGSCNDADVERFFSTSCSSASLKDDQSGVPDETCVNVFEGDPIDQAIGYRVTVVPESESCAPSTGTPEQIVQVLSCGSSEFAPGGCSGDALCVPIVNSGQGKLCELYDGDVSCSDPYPMKSILYGAAADNRDCQCSCSNVSGSGCTGAGVALNAFSGCTGTVYTTVPAGSCVDVSSYQNHDGYEVDTGTYSPGTCGAQPSFTGSVTFSTPQTLCCPS